MVNNETYSVRASNDSSTQQVDSKWHLSNNECQD